MDEPNNGPIARPNWPDDLNFPKAFPFANSGCSLLILPVPSSKTESSHCKDAKDVKELTTVADVNARQTAAAWTSLMAIALIFSDEEEEGAVTKWGTIARRTRPSAQLDTPRRAMTPSPILGMARRT